MGCSRMDISCMIFRLLWSEKIVEVEINKDNQEVKDLERI